MANYESTYKTNMFHVTDENRYQELVERLCGEDIEPFDKPMSQIQLIKIRIENDHTIYYKDDENNLVAYDKDKIDLDDILTAYDRNGYVIHDRTNGKDNRILHGFGGYGSIDYCTSDDEDTDYDFDVFLTELQKILPDDEAFIYMESGNEKLRCVNGYGIVVTKNDIKSIGVEQWCRNTAKEMLDKPTERTITLPVSVGDKVYTVINNEVIEFQVKTVKLSEDNTAIIATRIKEKETNGYEVIDFNPSKIGKNIFLTPGDCFANLNNNEEGDE